jgi:hypothetical protein
MLTKYKSLIVFIMMILAGCATVKRVQPKEPTNELAFLLITKNGKIILKCFDGGNVCLREE